MRITRIIAAIVLIASIYYSFNIDTRYWTSSIMCVPNPLFKKIVLLLGTILIVSYLIFKWQVGKIDESLKKVTHNKFGFYLSMVFVFCGIKDYIHVWSLFDESLKVWIIPGYVIIIYYIICLIIVGKETILNINNAAKLYDDDIELKWLHKQIELVNEASKEFEKKEMSSITMDQMLTYAEHEWHDIGFGVKFIYKFKSKNKYIITCHMDPTNNENIKKGEKPFAIVHIHDHPDILEGFYTEFGKYIDAVTGKEYPAGVEKIFDKKEAHEPKAYEFTIITITGDRI